MTIKIGIGGKIITGGGGSGGSQDLFDVLSIDNNANALQIKGVGNPTDPQDVVTLAFLNLSTPSLNQVLTQGNDAGPHNIIMDTGQFITIPDLPTNPTDATNKGYVDATVQTAVDGYNYSSLVILGDVTGTLGASTVVKLRGTSLASAVGTVGASQDGYGLIWNNGTTSWTPTRIVSDPTLAGDVTGLGSANTVVKIHGSPVTTIGAANTVLLTTNGTSIIYDTIVNAQIKSTAAITLGKLADASALSVVGRSANSTGAHADIAGTNNQVLRISGSVLGFGAVDVSTAQITGLLPFANFVDGSALSVTGRSANSSGVQASIAGANNQALRISGSVLGFGTIDISTAIVTGLLPFANIANGSALSVFGRSANTSGVQASITAVAASDSVLRESGSTIGFGTVATAGITNNAITDAKLRTSAGLSVVGRSANTTGNVADITATATGQVLRLSGTTLGFGAVDLADTDAVTGVLPTGNQASQTMGGDVSGTTAAATVIKIQANSVDNTALGANQDGYYAEWINGSSKIIFRPNNRLTPYVTITGTSTLTDGYNLVLVDTSAARTINLPAPASNVGVVFRIKDIIGTAGANNITLVRNASEKIEGVAASRILSTNWGYWEIWTNGTDWFFLN